MNEHKDLLTKWLQNLLYLHIAILVISAVNAITNLESITQWISWAVSIGIVFCLYQLRNINPRYKKSAIFQAVVLICNVLALLSVGGTGPAWVISVCGFIAVYQEYHGHSELVAEADDRLSRKWAGLFLWSLGLGLISGFAGTAVILIGVTAEVDAMLLADAAVIVATVASAVEVILYLRYMKQTLKLLEKEV